MHWCQIFKIGTHKDSRGNEKTWTNEDLEKIKLNFENNNQDVPICCGHPKTNAPAYGWVEKLKIENGKLYASYKNVQEEFKKAVNKGLFKTRSISLTPDLMLRHIAFLGAQPPAIKGMEQFCFEENENDIVINFQENEEKMEEKLQKTEQELNEALAENQKLKEQLQHQQDEKTNKEFEDFCEKAIEKGCILPSHKNNVMEVLKTLSVCEYDFEDGENKKAPIETFKELIDSLHAMEFSEIATKNKVQENKEIDFSDSNAVKNAILETQNEYSQKGIKLSATEAYEKLKENKNANI